MKNLSVAILLFACSGLAASADLSGKQSVLDGYRNRCMQVNTQRGIEQQKAISICSCETKIMDKNFTQQDFEQMANQGKADAAASEKIKKVKVEIAQCKP